MDFIGLPKFGGWDTIWVVVNRLSKYAHFIPLRHPFTATTVADKFMWEIIRLHKLPLSIISDRDMIFFSQFRQELFRLNEVDLNTTRRTIPKLTDNRRRWTVVWRLILGVFVQKNRRVGQDGWHGQSSGIIHRSIHLQSVLLSKPYMEETHLQSSDMKVNKQPSTPWTDSWKIETQYWMI